MSVKAYYNEYKRVKKFGLFKLQEIMVIEILLELLELAKKATLFLTVKNKHKSNKIRHKSKQGMAGRL